MKIADISINIVLFVFRGVSGGRGLRHFDGLPMSAAKFSDTFLSIFELSPASVVAQRASRRDSTVGKTGPKFTWRSAMRRAGTVLYGRRRPRRRRPNWRGFRRRSAGERDCAPLFYEWRYIAPSSRCQSRRVSRYSHPPTFARSHSPRVLAVRLAPCMIKSLVYISLCERDKSSSKLSFASLCRLELALKHP